MDLDKTQCDSCLVRNATLGWDAPTWSTLMIIDDKNYGFVQFVFVLFTYVVAVCSLSRTNTRYHNKRLTCRAWKTNTIKEIYQYYTTFQDS